MIQKSFFKSKSEYSKSRIAYGGDTRGKRKVFRPLDRRRKLHVTLKSSHAKGAMSFLSHKLAVAAILRERASQNHITIHRSVNMGNHIHMVVSFKTRELMQKFMRIVTGLIAKLITKAKRGRAFGKRFWDYLAHTRIVTGQKDFARLMHDFDKNEVERDVGSHGRDAIEDFDEITRIAKKRGVSFQQVAAERESRKRCD